MLCRAERRGDATQRPQAGLQVCGHYPGLQAGIRHGRPCVAQQRASAEPNTAFVTAHSAGFAPGQDDRIRAAAARDGFGLNLHQQAGVDQVTDLHECGRRTDAPEHLTVRLAKRPGIADVGDKHPGAHHVLEARAGLSEGSSYDLENSPCLHTDITLANHPALGIHCGCPGNKNMRPHSNSTTVTNIGLPLGPGGNDLTIHGLSSARTR